MANELFIPNQNTSVVSPAAFDPQSMVNSSWISDLSIGYSSGVRGPGLVVGTTGLSTKDVSWTAGLCVIGNAAFNIAAGTVALPDASALPRIDIVYVSAGGAVTALSGQAASVPLEPAALAGTIKLAAVWVPSGGASTYIVLASHIYSRRIEMPLPAGLPVPMPPDLNGVNSYVPLNSHQSQNPGFPSTDAGHIHFVRFTPSRVWTSASWTLSVICQSGGSANMRMAVYDSTLDGKPGNLVESFANSQVNSGTAYAVKDWAASSSSLIPGRCYFAGIQSQTSFQTQGFVVDNGPTSGSGSPYYVSGSQIRTVSTMTYGNWPSTAPAVGVFANGNMGGYQLMISLKVLT